MKKIFCLFALTAIAVVGAQAQDKQQIAIFDPAVSGQIFDEGYSVIVREVMSAAVVGTGKFSIVERSLIEKIIGEQKFSNSGMVDAGQASELGRMAGADKVILPVLSTAGKQGMLSIKLVDVASGMIENQKTKLVSPDDVIGIVEATTFELLGMAAAPAAAAAPAPAPAQRSGLLGALARGRDNDREEDKEREAADDLQQARERHADAIQTQQTLGNVQFCFEGTDTRNDCAVHLRVNGQRVGSGTLLRGFDLRHELPAGRHSVEVHIERGNVTKSFTINTEKRQRFDFRYGKTGFGYEMQLVN